jgi:hypothetical protein
MQSKIVIIALFISVISCVSERSSATFRHTIVAFEEGRFHGWPANNGVWVWGNEILVGFTQTGYEASRWA